MSAAYPRAVVLLSGGLDSATILAIAKSEGRILFPFTVDYGQRHHHEVEAARRVAEAQGAGSPVLFRLDLRSFGGSALTDDIAVPLDSLDTDAIPVTYVPARNTIFLALAAGYAESIAAEEIWIGVNAVDFSGYPDCRPEFVSAFQRVILTGTKSGVERGSPIVRAPLIDLTKKEIVLRGISLGVDYSLTHSCYDPDESGRACGHCDSCILRRKGFEDAGVPDPTHYADSADS